ncbi:hypothetical protein ACOSZF_12935 [Cytobacillus firmus]|uniref:hypothetical protein n=1 Tax=Cytobacillus firmus TaxID=1399 RepID=UPI0015802A0A|nr:hypothetical protein [Cytobacillus firmus]MBG9549261.1 hypothetical protein [Cytobacillus firmus]MBG9602109.1 hypothetical protein [Cytobacillus firmus]MBG9654557.1 hypothetical protein [Cytobacillus firmus]MED1905619.1 hypothetical protein [Cytobacillus firmus]MED1940409.1 hypothetical protein [Cytobacillus firmus]
MEETEFVNAANSRWKLANRTANLQKEPKILQIDAELLQIDPSIHKKRISLPAPFHNKKPIPIQELARST